jgi:hypothetical protein
MAKNSITDYDNVANNNTDIQSVDIAENCAPSGINNAIRELMADLADVNDGTVALTSPKAGSVTTDTISESTTDNGVAVDGMTIKDGAVGTTASPATANLTSINGGQIGGRRNIAYNGQFQDWVHSTSASSSATTNAYFAASRWRSTRGHSSTTAYERSTDAPDGFAYSYKISTTTASGALGSGAYEYLSQRLMGLDIPQFKYGTASAKSVTFSFWVKSSLTGDYATGLYLYAGGATPTSNENIGTTITINSANTWEKKTITYVPNTSFSPQLDENIGAMFYIFLAAGTDYTSTDNTSWGSHGNTGFAYGQTIDLRGTTGASFQIAGFQWEVGSVATEFEYRSLAEEQQLCQQFYIVSTGTTIWSGYATSGIYHYVSVDFPVKMRTTPAVSCSIIGGTRFAATNPAPSGIGTTGFYGYKAATSTGAGNYYFTYQANAEI